METNEIRAAVDEFLTRAGVDVAVDYVPPSKRGSAEKVEWGSRWLEWRVTLSRGARRAVFTFRAGEGHCPAKQLPVKVAGNVNSIMRDSMIRAEIDSGKTFRPNVDHHKATGADILPDIAGVLSCYLTDATAYQQTFEDWASDYGYDTDSRKAENVYRACVEAGRKLSTIFTQAEQEELRGILADY